MFEPSLEDMTKMDVTGYRYIPLKEEIYSDFFTPIMVLKKLRSITDHCFILESNEHSNQWGQYSFIGFNPKHEITCNNYRLTFDGFDEGRKNPTKYIRQFMNFKDVDLMFFDEIICFDHYKQKISIIVNVETNNLEEDYQKKCERIIEIENIIKHTEMKFEEPLRLKSAFTSQFSKEEYCAKVEIVKNHIIEGDIFQAVLANRLEAKCSGSLLDTYRILRTTNPSPYMFYFHSQTLEVAGASPETMVKLENGIVSSFPIAGTRPRGRNDEEDERLIEDLLHDEKELAEHNMLVDLGRNDLGSISEIGSVKVDSYKEVLKFSKVIHIASKVSGKLTKDRDALDALEHTLPAGTLSGAPKIRAVNIISELEGVKRGIYGGAIGYLDLTGNMDTCIAIRLVYKKKDEICVRSGAGIVADSIAMNEYQECRHKAQAVIRAMEKAQEGLE